MLVKIIWYTHKKFKTSIKSWVSILKSLQSHKIPLINSFRKTMEHIRNHRLSYQTVTTKNFLKNLLALEIKKIQIFMDKLVYFGLSIL